ncbi:hypothetical protein [Streptacidiphilus neutrinimicus]|uniref:hypothetical protein n=1 Tax=Streptacidiphilus neutrinimicus TaxID=105420 RepID=UPI0005AB16C2|nr:hypothetical protein [Streptacidiphilus neutrinimicus]
MRTEPAPPDGAPPSVEASRASIGRRAARDAVPPPVRAGPEGAARALGGLAEGVERLLGR